MANHLYVYPDDSESLPLELIDWLRDYYQPVLDGREWSYLNRREAIEGGLKNRPIFGLLWEPAD